VSEEMLMTNECS